ncbi:hypothetical protein RB195_015370 [Necator americanus]|uniref:Uncharacterized protein n=1 Tax=Necator americanus TaxID=51031 RepID=A0ABR1E488_NECAM
MMNMTVEMSGTLVQFSYFGFACDCRLFSAHSEKKMVARDRSTRRMMNTSLILILLRKLWSDQNDIKKGAVA